MGLLDTGRDAWAIAKTAARTGYETAGPLTRPNGVRTKNVPEGFPVHNSMMQWFVMPQGRIDTSSIGDGTGNSIVIAALMMLATSYAEPSFAVFDATDDPRNPARVPQHPFELLYRQPNDFFVGDLLDFYITMATHIDGNAYLRKVRSAAGKVLELWPLMPDLVEPKGTSSEFITHYEYNPGATAGPQKIPTEDIIHLKIGLDPEDYTKGLAPVKAALREIFTDEEAGQYAAALLKNMGIPGVVISPKGDDPGPDGPQADRIKGQFQERFGGNNRGAPLVIEGGAVDINVVSFSPEQMDFTALRRLPEERVCADMGVPPILAYLGAGMQVSSGVNELDGLSKHFTRRKLKPTWRMMGQQLTAQCGEPDFWEGNPNLKGTYDLEEVEDLREDKDLSIGRFERGVTIGSVMVSEHRNSLGLESDESHDVYLRPASVLTVGADGDPVDPPEPGPDPE